MKRSQKILALLLALSMALSLAACGKKDKDDGNAVSYESTGGKDIVRAAAADDIFTLNSSSKRSMNPIIATNHANQLICHLVYENMVELDNNFEVIPNLITSWECTDDGRIWTLYMDPENPHYFHDGEQVTGKDLRYSLERAINGDRFVGRFASFQGVSYWDDKIQVTLGIGDKQFIKLLNIPVIKNGTYDTGDGNPPVGSGPYTYNEDHTQLIAAETWPNYKDLPIDTIYISEYPTAADVISAFEDGYIDLVINDPSSYTNLGYASTNEIHSYNTTNMHYVAFNAESELGRDSSFRYAMNFAFDRAYLEELLGGNAVASPIAMNPSCSLYPTSLASQLKYDLELCKVVLGNAGIRDYDEDGRMEYLNASYEPELVFLVCSDSSAKTGIARRFASDMAELGLKVTLKEVSWDDYKKALEAPDHENEKNYYREDEEPPIEFDMYYGEVKLRSNFDITELLQPRTKDNLRSNCNYTRSGDDGSVNLINQYLAAGDADRANVYYQLCQYVSSQALIIPIGFEKQQIISHRGVIRGMDPNIGNPLYNFANWTIDLE